MSSFACFWTARRSRLLAAHRNGCRCRSERVRIFLGDHDRIGVDSAAGGVQSIYVTKPDRRQPALRGTCDPAIFAVVVPWLGKHIRVFANSYLVAAGYL